MSEGFFLQSLLNPSKVFQEIANNNSTALAGVLRFTLFILLLPPVFSWFGGSYFGWRLGGSEAVFMDSTGAIVFSAFYFFVLCVGFISTVALSRWMAPTYGASNSLTLHLALFSIICLPISVASMAHLFPDVFFNVLVLLPAALWSASLLYRGLPVLLQIPPERGMLMASALVGWLLVAAVSLLGLCTAFWVKGAGSFFGI